jgi:solute carrier family 25 (mitochondrial phosphate transporter), member 23/24/25/41
MAVAQYELGTSSTLPDQLSSDDAPVPLENLQRAQKAFAAQKSRLTSYLPEPGYFVVGAVAGAVSRTCTAPLDRLKVYLLVNTKSSANVALDAAKHGHPMTAIAGAVRPIGEAIRSLYRIGGLQTFFAGKETSNFSTNAIPAMLLIL